MPTTDNISNYIKDEASKLDLYPEVLDWDTFANRFGSDNGYAVHYRVQLPKTYARRMQDIVDEVTHTYAAYCSSYELIRIVGRHGLCRFGFRIVLKSGDALYVYTTKWENYEE